MNSTPFVRQYGILNNKWGVKLCQERKGIKNTRQNSEAGEIETMREETLGVS